MGSSAIPDKPMRPSQFPGTPVATQQLSSAQATSTTTTTTTKQEVSVSHSPAILSLQQATTKPKPPRNTSSTPAAMARDNGKRGSYRHVSESKTKDTSESIELQDTSPVGNNSPRADINISPPLPTNFKNLKRNAIDEIGLLGDGFFDSAPSSLNDKYPTMTVPGSVPRRMFGSPRVSFDNSPTWNETIFAGGFYAFALFGFLFTMYTGLASVGAYLWALVAELFGKGA